MRTSTLTILSLLIGFAAHSQKLRLSTSSDSALFYYYEGWRQVMDEGDYTASEKAYRKIMSFDPDFTVGLSLLGRITRNLEERLEIEKTLHTKRNSVVGDERLLLDNYIGLVQLTNLRETDPEAAKIQLDKVFATGEKNLHAIVHRYRDEIYYKAEYIEVLHRNHGPQAALDSMVWLLDQRQKEKPFLIGYAAHMEAEAGAFDQALARAKKLDHLFKGSNSPKPFVVYSDIYFQMGKLAEAEKYVTKALALDPGNIDAQRLEKKIKAGMQK